MRQASLLSTIQELSSVIHIELLATMLTFDFLLFIWLQWKHPKRYFQLVLRQLFGSPDIIHSSLLWYCMSSSTLWASCSNLLNPILTRFWSPRSSSLCRVWCAHAYIRGSEAKWLRAEIYSIKPGLTLRTTESNIHRSHRSTHSRVPQELSVGI